MSCLSLAPHRYLVLSPLSCACRCRGADHTRPERQEAVGRQRHSHRLYGAGIRQAGATRQAAAEAQGRRSQGAHILPDDTRARHHRGLSHQQEVHLRAHRRPYPRQPATGSHRSVQSSRQRQICVSAVYEGWWAGHQSHRGRYLHHLRLRLEPPE